MLEKRRYATVDEYIASFPDATQQQLHQLRSIIRHTAPDATETISYNMPAYKQKGMLVYFAAYAKHIGFYPTGSGIAAFIDRLASFKTSKGTVQFPLTQPLPVTLIEEIVRYRVAENEQIC